MDEYLDDAWQNAEPPFDGQTMRNLSPLSPSELQLTLQIIVNELQRRFGRGQKLLTMADRHEIDGFREEGAPLDFIDLQKRVSTEERLFGLRQPEEPVHRAAYPVSGEWLMRWTIGVDRRGEFTFTADDDVTTAIAAALKPVVAVDLQPSADYFKRTHRG